MASFNAQPSNSSPKIRARYRTIGNWFRFRWLAVYALIIPSLILMVGLQYYPALYSLVGGFTNSDGFLPSSFVGFSNFVAFFRSDTFVPDIEHIGLLLLAGLLVSLVFPFLGAKVATVLPGKLNSIYKYLIVIPMVIPYVIVINVWAYLLNPTEGLIDAVLGLIHLEPVQWLSGPHTALLSIMLIGFPWVSGLPFLIFLGGLQNIPIDVYDASSLDGARLLRRLWSVELPICFPQIRLVTLLALIGGVQNFISILLLTNGGPGNATMVPGLQMYTAAFTNDQFGNGMAIGGLMFAFLLLMTGVVFRVLRDRT